LHPLDFALIKSELENTGLHVSTDDSLTRGTLHFIAPDAILEDRLDQRLDVLREKLDC
jgi:flagellar biosynthesis/type III secretory pathway protein FliH